jgi:hypothetical protein
MTALSAPGHQGELCITPPKSHIIVILKERRIRRELKDHDFSSAVTERKERQGPSLALRLTMSRN